MFKVTDMKGNKMNNKVTESYLDNAATTRVIQKAADVVQQVMLEDYGNPSSKHSKGMTAEGYLKKTRAIIASTLKCSEKEIVFTSGGTESNNQAIISTVLANRRSGKHIITTVTEHASVLEPFGFLEREGYEVSYIKVDEFGKVIPEELEKALREDTVLVSVMYVNNEIGSINDIKKLSEMIKKNSKAIFHVDAIQAYGKLTIRPSSLGIDLMSVSSHKIHGPKGTGFLYINNRVKIFPYIYGGGQEGLLRSGTQNVPAIAGMGVAIENIYNDHEEKLSNLYSLKQYMIDKLEEMDGIYINGVPDKDISHTAPHILSVSIDGIRSEVLLNALSARGIYISSGSACSSNRPELSGTLKAIGVKEELLDSTVRFSFSIYTTIDEIDYAIDVLRETLPVLRKFTRK